MNVLKTALVSTIALGIAMSAAALSAGPSFAAQTESPARTQARAMPKLPETGKQVCSTALLALAAGVNTSTGLTITFTLGAAKPVALIFSTEVTVAALGNTVSVTYSIDGATPIIIGPNFFADDTLFTTRTAYGLTGTLKAGKHTITPFLEAFGAGGGTADFRCFAVLNTGF